jgi:DNA-binding transcriptional LysR family regulator
VEALALLLLSGAYVGYLPRHYAASWVERGDLHELQHGTRDFNHFELAVRRRVSMTPAIEAFLLDLTASLPRGHTRRPSWYLSDGDRVPG